MKGREKTRPRRTSKWRENFVNDAAKENVCKEIFCMPKCSLVALNDELAWRGKGEHEITSWSPNWPGMYMKVFLVVFADLCTIVNKTNTKVPDD